MITLPESEKREFYGSILKNNIKNINIYDKNLDTSSVIVAVNIGFLSDPIEYQGLAHFLEHMLFLGSDKYPKEDSFEKFISENGGYSNAYTDKFETVYYFTIYNNKLEEAMDMFSRFFIDPLFNIDSVNREINAIESEHSKNINNDYSRIFHLVGLISNENSMINKFSTGNLNTLKKPGVRDKMIEFYKKYYTSSNMSVVVVSSLDNTKIKKYVDNTFGEIKLKEKESNKLIKPFFDNKNQSFFLKSIADENKIVYFWEIPSHRTNYLFSHSDNILEEIINSRTENSLYEFLSLKGLINDLFCMSMDHGIFMVFFILTDIKYFNEVDSYFKYYIDNLKNENWKKICDFYQKKDKVLFNYSEKEASLQLGIYLSTNLHLYNLEDVLYKSKVINKINPDEIKSLVTDYLNFDRVNILICSQQFEDYNKDKLINEENYKLEYYPIKLNNNLPKKFKYEIIDDNPYLNIKPKLFDEEDKNNKPILMYDNSNKKKYPFQVWFGNSFNFGERVVYGNLSYTNINFVLSIENFIGTIIFLKYLQEKVNIYFSLQEQIGFVCSTSFNNLSSIVNVKIFGHNDKYQLFFNEVVKFLNDFKFNLDDIGLINSIIESEKETINNINMSNPWQYSDYLIGVNSNKNSYKIKELLNFLENYTSGEFEKYFNDIKNNIFNQSKLTCYFYGNVTQKFLFEDENLDLSKLNTFNEKSNFLNILSNIEEVHPNKNEENNFVQYSFYIGKFNPLEELMSLILSIAMSQQFYDSLRTKQQFGYLVGSGRKRIKDDLYVIEKVQSTKNIDEIELAINKFNSEFLDFFTKEEYEKYLESAINILEERETNTFELYAKFESEILLNRYLFDKDEIILKQVKNCNYNKIKEFFTEKILNENPIKCIIRSPKSN